MNSIKEAIFSFPEQLEIVKHGLLSQEAILKEVAKLYADAIMDGGVIYVYANGHSRISVEEVSIRMGALTGFHGIIQVGLTSFTDVVGSNGIRVNQGIERYEGISANILDEYDIGPKDVMAVITATGTTPAAVDMAIEFNKRYPNNPIVGIASKVQSIESATKHSSNKNLIHVIKEASKGIFIDNAMPYGDLSVTVNGQTDTYQVCPLSSIGALSVVQSLNELTIRELDRRNYQHHVLRNMHISNTADNYNEWLQDQRKRYARAMYNPNKLVPQKE
ncbi:sugar isomerase domain-containing protein [Flavivirga eckloniae]|uniref:SIS domain-containing protein n=1 Tax=Flavivirga eckloniae TaxID=1803846 RepID=A0A2K9PN91_9FLAO|nr:sugar isomerase domain-containing protein [Flavivirga eckloniae]AUP78524.1 hypothetical protein C1H87_07295 [Flavivirga eckloniae]